MQREKRRRDATGIKPPTCPREKHRRPATKGEGGVPLQSQQREEILFVLADAKNAVGRGRGYGHFLGKEYHLIEEST